MPAKQKPAKKSAAKTMQAASWKMPKLPTVALDAGGYATAGFITSLAAASVLSVGVRASRRKRARRRAERSARLAQDKLKQKDRWTAAIDTDVVSAEVAERAAKIAEEAGDAARAEDAQTKNDRDALRRAYDEFLRASKADKKM